MVRKLLSAVALAGTASLFAGGFWLQMGTPEASPEAKTKKATLVVKAAGCHDPATATVSGIVIRTVDGRRQTSPVKMLPMKEPGTFAVVRDWPDDADVTLEFIGHNVGAVTSMLVHARGESVQRTSAKFYARMPTPEEEESAALVR